MNGLIYCALVGATYWWIQRNLWVAGELFMERLIFFQISLSVFRFGWNKWDYMTPDPKSITDKIQNFIFGGHGVVMYTIYSLIFITLLYVIFLT